MTQNHSQHSTFDAAQPYQSSKMWALWIGLAVAFSVAAVLVGFAFPDLSTWLSPLCSALALLSVALLLVRRLKQELADLRSSLRSQEEYDENLNADVVTAKHLAENNYIDIVDLEELLDQYQEHVDARIEKVEELHRSIEPRLERLQSDALHSFIQKLQAALRDVSFHLETESVEAALTESIRKKDINLSSDDPEDSSGDE